ncbi:MAG: hypothetical protein M1840_006514 [Geoglossum simile]|nr:MAG: hypothetical protein M1840_006514 [Geoglossum simile]
MRLVAASDCPNRFRLSVAATTSDPRDDDLTASKQLQTLLRNHIHSCSLRQMMGTALCLYPAETSLRKQYERRTTSQERQKHRTDGIAVSGREQAIAVWNIASEDKLLMDAVDQELKSQGHTFTDFELQAGDCNGPEVENKGHYYSNFKATDNVVMHLGTLMKGDDSDYQTLQLHAQSYKH